MLRDASQVQRVKPAVKRDAGASGKNRLRWGAEVYAALFVELLRGFDVQGIASDAAAQTIGSNVAQRSAFPCIGDSEYEAAIASHENILFLFTRRGWCAVRFRFDLARGARTTRCTLHRRRVIGDFLIIGRGRLRVGRL